MAAQVLPALAPENVDAVPATPVYATAAKVSFTRRVFEFIAAAQARRAARHIALYCSDHTRKSAGHDPPP